MNSGSSLFFAFANFKSECDMEVTVEQFEALEERVEKMSDVLDSIHQQLKKLDIIQIGLFGSETLNSPGVIKELKSQREELEELRGEVEKLKSAKEIKNSLVDDVEKWLKRVFWIIACSAGAILLMTGKIGVADLWK